MWNWRPAKMERARFSPVMNVAMAVERRSAIKEAFHEADGGRTGLRQGGLASASPRCCSLAHRSLTTSLVWFRGSQSN